MLNLHRLRLLHAFRLRGTVSAAAAAMGLSPSTVSQQLSQLELEAGAELFHRGGRSLRLTHAGLRLAEHAQAMLDLQDEAMRSLSAGEPELSGVLRLSVFQSVALALAPQALSSMKADHPGLRVEMVQAPPERALFDLAGRRHDLVVAEQYPGVSRPRQPEFDIEELGSDRLWLVVPEQLAGIEPEDLDAYPWVMEPAGTASREWCLQQCRSLGFEPDVRFTTDDLTSHLRLIRAGLAVGLLPQLLLTDQDTAGTALLPLPDAPARTIYTTARRASAETPAAQACRAAIREAFLKASPQT